MDKCEVLAKIREQVCKRVRHVKRGSEYDVIGIARLQTSMPLSDMDALVVYRGADGDLWVRPQDEFEDGRFEPVE